MLRLFLLCLLSAFFVLLSGTVYAGRSVQVAVNFDGETSTLYRLGEKSQGGSPPAGFSTASVGTVDTCDVSESGGTTTVSVKTAGDEGGRCLVYKTQATDADLHVELELQSIITGDQSPFNGCGPFVAEEGDTIDDYASYAFYPIAGNSRFKTDAGGAGELVQFSGDGETLPEFLLIQYDDSMTLLEAAHGADGSNWTRIESAVTKSLNFASNVIYGLACFTDNDAVGAATFQITDLVADNTIETLSGGGGGTPSLIFDEDFTSTTWYENAGWGAGANGAGPSGDPRTANGPAPGQTFTRATGTNFGISERDGAYGLVVITSGYREGTNASIYFSELGVDLPSHGEDVWLQYWQAYGTDYTPTHGGKGPGFADSGTGGCGFGGAPCDGTDGWSLRSLPGNCTSASEIRLDTYAYHADMPGTWGENFDWDTMGCGEAGVAKNDGSWRCIEKQVRINSAGAAQNDGILRVWVDNVQVLNRTNLQLDNAGNFPVARVWWNVYHGGGPTAVAPNDMHVAFDDIQISTTARINTCP